MMAMWRGTVTSAIAVGKQFLNWIAPQDPYQLSELISVLSPLEQEKLQELAMKVTALLN
jgi:hypothetical protein